MYSSNLGNELYHYGVLGMKWGVHRAKKLNSKAQKYRAKGDKYRANKYETKARSITAKNKRLGGKAYDYTRKQSLGKTFTKLVLMGSYGTLKYNQVRANGVNRGKAAVTACLANLGNNATAYVLSIVEPRVTASKKDKA